MNSGSLSLLYKKIRVRDRDGKQVYEVFYPGNSTNEWMSKVKIQGDKFRRKVIKLEEYENAIGHRSPTEISLDLRKIEEIKKIVEAVEREGNGYL